MHIGTSYYTEKELKKFKYPTELYEKFRALEKII